MCHDLIVNDRIGLRFLFSIYVLNVIMLKFLGFLCLPSKLKHSLGAMTEGVCYGLANWTPLSSLYVQVVVVGGTLLV